MNTQLKDKLLAELILKIKACNNIPCDIKINETNIR